MPYCFMDLRPFREGEGREPDFPEGVDFLLLADLRASDWGIFEYATGKEHEDWTPVMPVSDVLDRLIESGKRYPPALALTRDDLERRFVRYSPDREAFQKAYIELLERHLSRQLEDGFILARATRDELGYLEKGGWYWVLSAQDDPTTVSWVSDDYFVYHTAAGDFEL